MSSSVSALSPMPSMSLSAHSLALSGNLSSLSTYPSLSSSGSSTSQMVSLSKSSGKLVASFGSVRQSNSSLLFQPSLSRSLSVLSPMPSPSPSSHSSGSSGNESSESITPSPSVSSSNRSQIPSASVSCGTLVLSYGSVPQLFSMESYQPSPSASREKNVIVTL